MALAMLAGLMPLGCSAGEGAVATDGRPALVRVGAAPPLGPGQRRVVSGKLTELEPPPGSAISVEVLLRDGQDARPVSIGRFSPFPLTRITPEGSDRHPPFSVPADPVVPARGGGDWWVELRLSVDPPQPARARFGQVAFSSD